MYCGKNNLITVLELFINSLVGSFRPNIGNINPH